MSARLLLIVIGFYVALFCMIGLVKLSNVNTAGVDVEGDFTPPLQLDWTVDIDPDLSSIVGFLAGLWNLLVNSVNFIISLLTILITGVGFTLTGFGAGGVGYFLTMILFTPLGATIGYLIYSGSKGG